MKLLLKNLGLILMAIGALILIGSFCLDSDAVNNNAVLGTSIVLIILGLISYIVINKRITE